MAKQHLNIKPEMRKPLLKMLIILVVVFGLIVGYRFYRMIKQFSSMKPPQITVSAMEAKEEQWDPTLTASGSVKAIEGVTVTTQIDGMVAQILFEAGGEVVKNQPLIQLHDATEVAHLRALEASADLARINLTRDRAQFDIKAVSQAVIDTDVANVKNTQALVDQQQSIVNKKLIKAPFSGRLGVRLVNLGQFLRPGDDIVTLQRLDPIFIDFYLPQQQVVQTRVGQPITFISDAFPELVFKGKITTINPIVDDPSRNGLIQATVSNPNLLLLPGMFGTVEIKVGKPYMQVTVPQSAINYNAYGEIAYIVHEDNTNIAKDEKNNKSKKEKTAKNPPSLIARQTFVKVGDTRGDQIAVLQGIKAGDKVVTSGQMKLRNGVSVVINNDVVPSNNPSPHPKNE